MAFNLLLRAICKRQRPELLTSFKPPDLAKIAYSSEYHFDNKHYATYCQRVGWSTSQSIHPVYLQVLSLSQQLRCLLDSRCPYPILGMIHVNNEICIRGQFKPHLPFSLSSRFDCIDKHAKGWLINLHIEVKQEGQCCYTATAGYLIKANAPHVVKSQVLGVPSRKTQNNHANEVFCARSSNLIRHFEVPATIGRQYAAVSGDYNVIHLSNTLAKLFGFPRAIAHGMWSQAKLVSVIAGENKGCLVNLRVAFKQPITIPNRVWITENSVAQNNEQTPQINDQQQPKRAESEIASGLGVSNVARHVALHNKDASKTYLLASLYFQQD